jgi:hypothetical protein
MAIRTELSLRLPNSPGALAGVCRLLADERVNILALAVEGTGQLRMVVDNHVRGVGVLRERHHRVVLRDVLVLPVANVPGALAPALELVAEAGINVEYAYGAAAENSHSAVVVLGVDDPLRAASRAGV